jgi:pimeloyl-ACP methyl ester carboxylesterase
MPVRAGIVLSVKRLRLVLLSLALLPANFAWAEERVMLDIRGVIERPALLFAADTQKAVVLAHQSGLDAGSWRRFAERLLQEGITSVALQSISSDDVLAAITLLEHRGQTDITLIGASIGGGAIIQALSRHDAVSVQRVILLATADGRALQSATRKKLFVVAMDDFFAARTYSSFNKAAEPKILIEYTGFEHGQELLAGPNGGDLLRAILDFVSE